VSARSRTTRSVLISLAVFGLACTDAPTGVRDDGLEERLVVSVEGVGDGDAGIVLRLSGSVQTLDPARPSVDLAWSTAESVTTVAIVGALGESTDLLIVRRRATSEPLRVEVVEVANSEGALSGLAPFRATVRALAAD
jgi:hypothetical protein